jgi:cobalt-zinc-cadmium efflux system protein
MTYGYHRVAILIAIINALALFGVSSYIFFEATRRFQEPPEVKSGLMLVIGAAGLGVNLIAAGLLARHRKENLNIASAFLHVVGDVASSLGVIVGAILLRFTDWSRVDPSVSVIIGLVILVGAANVIRQGLSIFLEATPRHVKVPELVEALKMEPGVKGVHDLHVWSIAPRLHALSCHVMIDEVPAEQQIQIRQRLDELLRRQFNIQHATVQFEFPSLEPDKALYQSMPDAPSPKEPSEQDLREK